MTAAAVVAIVGLMYGVMVAFEVPRYWHLMMYGLALLLAVVVTWATSRNS